jgi:hypothetical protein
MKRLLLAATLVAALAVQGDARSQAAADREAVHAAVLDYVEALYQAQPERIERSVHPDLAKRGYFRRRGETTFANEPMSYKQLHDLAGSWNKDKKRPVAAAPKEITIYEVLNQTASAKLTALWGIDYMHLAKYDGTWKIVNILWQEPPPGDGGGRR